MFEWGFAAEVLPELLEAFTVTLQCALFGTLIAFSLGLVLALQRRSSRRWVAAPAAGVVRFVRTTPLLVQLYVLFYLGPDLGLSLTPMVTGILVLGVHFSTYAAEVYRAGLEAVAREQWEAALVLDLSPYRTLRAVILPQALRHVLPALANYAIAMFKETPLLAAITVVEVLQTARLIGAEQFRYLEPYTLVGLLFLVATLALQWLVGRLERRLRLPGDEARA